ncbi:hypothetical protein ACQPZA_13365 [Pseudonocardia xinjiangensis]|uniref:hypothetical protein n=1 Tax=Pseudonocardia xinjiangensis TaxID=75289 RepID=UPI003D8A3912
MSTAPTTTPATVAPDLLILAMDHRESLARTVYEWRDPLTDEQAALIADGKQLVFAGLRAALDRGAPAGPGGAGRRAVRRAASSRTRSPR